MKNEKENMNTTLEIPEGSKAAISAKNIDGKNYLVVEVENKSDMIDIEEKALELIGKYQKHAMLKDFGGMDFEIARGCAIIGLDEMLDYIEVPSHIYQWFKQVRVELERVEQPCS